jgi:Fe-S oxidoreductase
VGCPYCNIMLSDGITERHADEQMSVLDVAQLLLQSVETSPQESG